MPTKVGKRGYNLSSKSNFVRFMVAMTPPSRAPVGNELETRNETLNNRDTQASGDFSAVPQPETFRSPLFSSKPYACLPLHYPAAEG